MNEWMNYVYIAIECSSVSYRWSRRRLSDSALHSIVARCPNHPRLCRRHICTAQRQKPQHRWPPVPRHRAASPGPRRRPALRRESIAPLARRTSVDGDRRGQMPPGRSKAPGRRGGVRTGRSAPAEGKRRLTTWNVPTSLKRRSHNASNANTTNCFIPP